MHFLPSIMPYYIALYRGVDPVKLVLSDNRNNYTFVNFFLVLSELSLKGGAVKRIDSIDSFVFV